MQVRIPWATLAGIAMLLAASSASADCEMKAVPLSLRMEGQQAVVKATVDGVEGGFFVDSGAYRSSMNAVFAKGRQLASARTGDTGTHIQVEAAGTFAGVANSPGFAALVQAKEFNLGGIRYLDQRFMTYQAASPYEGSSDRAGVIGQDILRRVDVEYDLGHQAMKLLVVSKDCKNADLMYWRPADTPYSLLPVAWADSGLQEGEVLINGLKMRAIFDTGAFASFITEAAAGRASVKVTDPGVSARDPVQGVDGSVKAWTARFTSVKIGDEEIRNGQLTIGRSSTDAFDVLLGADFFLSHHVLVSNSQNQIYFNYNGGPVFDLGHKEEPGADAHPGS